MARPGSRRPGSSPQARDLRFAGVVVVSLVVLFSPGPAVPQETFVSDKVVHATLFLALAVTGRLARCPLAPLVVGLVAYAGVSEVLQAVLPIARDGDPRDALADVAGVAAGIIAVALTRRLRASKV